MQIASVPSSSVGGLFQFCFFVFFVAMGLVANSRGHQAFQLARCCTSRAHHLHFLHCIDVAWLQGKLSALGKMGKLWYSELPQNLSVCCPGFPVYYK